MFGIIGAIIGAVLGFLVEQLFSLPDIVFPFIDNVINDPTSQRFVGIVPLMYLLKVLIYVGPPGIGGMIGYFSACRFDQG